jgi:hypothetical protein
MLKLKGRYYEMHNLLTEEMISITLKKVQLKLILLLATIQENFCNF